MESRRQKRKVKKNHEEEKKDRLSDLPDSLLLEILCFLPQTRSAVQTCVLSKKWKCLWTSLPDLIFQRHVLDDDNLDFPCYKEFVRNVLCSRQNHLPLRKLCFQHTGEWPDMPLTARIINYAASHNVQHFSISLCHRYLTILFPLFNSCRCSLKTLELGGFKDLHRLEDISLPALTTLRISNFTLSPVKSCDPFVGLFNLKSLELEPCQEFSAGGFKISGPQLRSLTICSGHFNFKVEIIAPKLRWFEFRGPFPAKFNNLDFPHLETATIDAYIEDVYKVDFKEEPHLDMMNMFRGLYNAKSLYLSSKTIESLMRFPGLLEDQGSPFLRLKTLNVKLESHCKRISIPNTAMNYFGRGTDFALSIQIEEGNARKVMMRRH